MCNGIDKSDNMQKGGERWRWRPHPAAAAALATKKKRTKQKNGRTSDHMHDIVNRFILVNSWYSINRLRSFWFFLWRVRYSHFVGLDVRYNGFDNQPSRVRIQNELKIPSRALMLSLFSMRSCLKLAFSPRLLVYVRFAYRRISCCICKSIACNHVNFAVAAAVATAAFAIVAAQSTSRYV